MNKYLAHANQVLQMMSEVQAASDLKNVHTEHCCVIHGCKYGEEDCCVVTKRLPQSFNCERCEEDGIHDLDDLKRVVAGITQTCPYCKHTLP